MAAPPRFLDSIYPKFPDDETFKEVILHAKGLSYGGSGDRHVMIIWENASTEDGTVHQIVQLTGQAGNYSYYTPVAKLHPPSTLSENQLFVVGNFSRSQRDEILEIARLAPFLKTSTTNGCRVWTRDLLHTMLLRDLISREKFDELDSGVPLVVRRPEA